MLREPYFMWPLYCKINSRNGIGRRGTGNNNSHASTKLCSMFRRIRNLFINLYDSAKKWWRSEDAVWKGVIETTPLTLTQNDCCPDASSSVP